MRRRSPYEKKRLLAIISEVNSSPQLLAVLLEAVESGSLVEVVVISDGKNVLAEQLKQNGVSVNQTLPRRKLHSGRLFLTVGRQILRNRPSILFTSGIYANVVGLTTSFFFRVNRRIFIRHHSNFHARNKNYFGMFVDRLCNFLATDIVAVSKLVEMILVKIESAPATKVCLIHNGIDLSKFKLNEGNSQTTCESRSNPGFKIGLVSRMTSLKGIEYAAKAFVKIHQKFPFASFIVVGKFADSYNQVKEILEELPDSSYSLVESVPSIPEFLSELDAFIHVPVGPEEESFGLVYLEALAMNLNCIFTVSGILNELPDIQKYVNVVGYKNSDDIYRCLYGLLSEEVGRKPPIPEIWLKQFDIEKMAKSYTTLFIRREKVSE